MSIDCPTGCSYLQAAHRWEREQEINSEGLDAFYPDVELPEDVMHFGRPLLSGFLFTVLAYAMEQHSLTDADVLAAAQALAETYRTLVSGIHYEKPPAYPVAAGLYAALAKVLEEEKAIGEEHRELPVLKDEQRFHVLVAFLRLGQMHSNGKRLTRSFIGFLRARFPIESVPEKEESRIVMP
jgi:hypothetical protein